MSTLSYMFIGVVALLLAWRLYCFTIKPFLRPNEPKEYPYWVPVLGHLRPFFQNSSKLLSDARVYFNNTHEPFALTVAGMKWYVITNGADVTATYRISEESLSYDIFAVEVMRMLGASKDGIEKSFQVDKSKETDNLTKNTLSAVFRDYSRLQLHPGERYDKIQRGKIRYISKYLDSFAITQQRSSWKTMQIKMPVKDVQLYRFISEIFVGFGQEIYFGEALAKVEPEMTSMFMFFDSLAWQVLYQYPSFLCRDMLGAKEKMLSALEKYFELPMECRKDAAWMTLELERDVEVRKLSKVDKSIVFFQLYWSVCGNIKKAPFWMLAHMLFEKDHDFLELVREESQGAIKPNGHIDIEYLLRSCPILNNIWDETVRVTAFGASVRFVTKDTEIGGKLLRRGNRIMMPQRQLHFDDEVFGKNANRFVANRFIKNEKLKRHPAFRPFGGGTTLCPGRYLAKQTSIAFIALLLHRFDIILDPPDQNFPTPTEGNPSIGLVDVMEGSDLRVKLRARGTEEEQPRHSVRLQ